MKRAQVKVDESLLKEVVRRILSVREVRSIILFGSHARGDAHGGSDLDILIIETENPLPRCDRALAYRMALGNLERDFDIDILVYTLEELEDWSEVPNAFPTRAVREGRVLYEERSSGPGQRVAG